MLNRTLIAVLAILFAVAAIAAENTEEKKPPSVVRKAIPVADCKTESVVQLDKEISRFPDSEQGDMLRIYAKGGTVADVVETKRKSRFASELSTILKAIADANNKDASAVQTFTNPCFEYRQTYERSKLDVVVRYQEADSDGDGKPDVDTEVMRRTDIILGPPEHWYFSADAPITNPRQLKYDSTQGKLVEKEVPSDFYLGINYKFGDLYENYDIDWNRAAWFGVGNVRAYNWSSLANRLFLKVMLKVDKDPSESWGIGLGYTTKYVDFFAANLWTQQDVTAAGSTLKHSDGVVYGVSFNISRGLEWLADAQE